MDRLSPRSVKAVRMVTQRCVMTRPWIFCDLLVVLPEHGGAWFIYLWLHQNAVLVIPVYFVDVYKARRAELLILIKALILVCGESTQIQIIGFQEFMRSPVGLCESVGQEGKQFFSSWLPSPTFLHPIHTCAFDSTYEPSGTVCCHGLCDRVNYFLNFTYFPS